MNSPACSLIPEIVDYICNQVDSLQSLATLARTCRFFQEPALSYLWYELETPVPLIMCMPADLWKIEKGWNKFKLDLSRAILPTDWTYALPYASRIRRLGFSRGRLIFPTVESSVYTALIDGAQLVGVLLPNIQRLRVWSHDPILPHIELFLGSRIQSLELPMNFDLVILSTLVDRYPLLQHIKFTHVPVHSSTQQDGVSAVICGWSHLHTLSTVGLTRRAIIHAASLPDLQCFSLRNLVETITFPDSAFPALRRLDLRAADLSLCISFIENLKLDLTEVELSYDRAKLSHWTDVGKVLLTTCTRSSLLKLSLLHFTSPDLDARGPSTHWDLLRPLFAFSNLTSINIEPGTSLNDGIVQELGQAWPRLKILHILDRTAHEEQTSRVTLQGLAQLAKFCPDLHHLAILLDTRSVERCRTRPGGGIRNFSLRSLNVGNSLITSPHLVASFLSDIFPNISHIISFIPLDADRNEEWEEVEQLIPLLASVRSQEAVYHDTDKNSD